MLQFNAHEVYEVLRTKRDNLSPHKSNGVALAIYPRVRLRDLGDLCHIND